MPRKSSRPKSKVDSRRDRVTDDYEECGCHVDLLCLLWVALERDILRFGLGAWAHNDSGRL